MIGERVRGAAREQTRERAMLHPIARSGIEFDGRRPGSWSHRALTGAVTTMNLAWRVMPLFALVHSSRATAANARGWSLLR